jgi:hypothetical protein
VAEATEVSPPGVQAVLMQHRPEQRLDLYWRHRFLEALRESIAEEMKRYCAQKERDEEDEPEP